MTATGSFFLKGKKVEYELWQARLSCWCYWFWKHISTPVKVTTCSRATIWPPEAAFTFYEKEEIEKRESSLLMHYLLDSKKVWGLWVSLCDNFFRGTHTFVLALPFLGPRILGISSIKRVICCTAANVVNAPENRKQEKKVKKKRKTMSERYIMGLSLSCTSRNLIKFLRNIVADGISFCTLFWSNDKNEKSHLMPKKVWVRTFPVPWAL